MYGQILFETFIAFVIAASYAAILLSILFVLDKALQYRYNESYKLYIESVNSINASIEPFTDFKILIQR